MRTKDAQTLFDARRYAGSYYICGFAVECAVKAIIATKFRRHDIPDKDLIVSIYQHNLPKLVDIAGLKAQLADDTQANAAFFAAWNVVKDWNVNCRYNCGIRKLTARDMLSATTDPTDGVIPWLQHHW